jgi:hypothetical protein
MHILLGLRKLHMKSKLCYAVRGKNTLYCDVTCMLVIHENIIFAIIFRSLNGIAYSRLCTSKFNLLCYTSIGQPLNASHCLRMESLLQSSCNIKLTITLSQIIDFRL